MKRFIRFNYFCLFFIGCSLLFFGCAKNELTAEFVRFSIEQRQNDYYLDFTIKFENNTNDIQQITENDFFIEINTEEKNDLSFLYENEEVFYPNPTININENLTIRIRVITEIKNKDHNTILLKYKDKTIINDNIYISNNKKD